MKFQVTVDRRYVDMTTALRNGHTYLLTWTQEEGEDRAKGKMDYPPLKWLRHHSRVDKIMVMSGTRSSKQDAAVIFFHKNHLDNLADFLLTWCPEDGCSSNKNP